MADIAWSNFQAGWDEEKRAFTKRIKPGDTVSASDLDISDEEFEELKKIGSVREQEYPESVADGSYPDSPNRYFMDQLQKAAEGMLSADEMKELQSSGVLAEAPPTEDSATKAPAAKK